MTDQSIVAVALLTREDVKLLGSAFDRIWPVESAPNFAELLQAIDKADAELKAAKARKTHEPG